MSSSLAPRKSLYDQLCELPEGLTGEILNGQLHTQPRPSLAHALASSRLGAGLDGPFGVGRGGPGGWWIIDEPEVHFVLDTVVVVPDIAGWRKVRLPSLPEGHKIELAPDWICEVLSPSTKGTDREEKMPLYAQYGVSYAWLIDPKARTLEAYKRVDQDWMALGFYRDDDRVRAEPFDAIEISLLELWS